MNISMVRYLIGRIIIILALLMLPSVIVALIYGEGIGGVLPFLITMGIALIPGFILSYKKPENAEYYTLEGFVVVALSWLLFSLIGGLPLLFGGSVDNIFDSFFEAASGFTTTGSSIIENVEILSHSQLFWRSFTHLIGGMGILVFALAILPSITSEDVFVMKAEVPGPMFGKIRAKLSSSARILYIIYLSMTAILILVLWLGGMPIFDSFIHAFGAAGTGGFGMKLSSVAYYQNPFMEYVLGIAMLLFGVNFNLYYFLLMRQFKSVFKNEELRWYFGIFGGVVALILLNTISVYDNFGTQFRDVFFTASSIMTTTGFCTINYDTWPMFSRILLGMLMFVGAMAGSTAGGLKISRVAIYIKSVFQEIRRQLSPNRSIPVRFEGKKLRSGLVANLFFYLGIYILIFIILLLIVATDLPDFASAFSSVAATFNNIGPGMKVVGPAGNYAGLAPYSKFALSIGMIMGRLEIIPIIVLFSPRTWRRH